MIIREHLVVDTHAQRLFSMRSIGFDFHLRVCGMSVMSVFFKKRKEIKKLSKSNS